MYARVGEGGQGEEESSECMGRHGLGNVLRERHAGYCGKKWVVTDSLYIAIGKTQGAQAWVKEERKGVPQS